jgi:hypothetical protein
MFTIFFISIVTVNGPIPPGTGVYNSKSFILLLSTSPIIFFEFYNLFIPTSNITHPAFTYFTKLGDPAAAIITSASKIF